MPHNKRESLIFSIIVCFLMVLVMSFYNVSMNMGGLSAESIKEGWLGFPFAFVIAFICDTFIASKIAKGFAFRCVIKPDSSDLTKILAISCSMVVCMVIMMSLYGAVEMAVATGNWNMVAAAWLRNIPRNFVMALPLNLLVVGPFSRRLFRTLFPVGKVLA